MTTRMLITKKYITNSRMYTNVKITSQIKILVNLYFFPNQNNCFIKHGFLVAIKALS